MTTRTDSKKGEGFERANAEPLKTNQNQHPDSASTDTERKALAGLQAAFALKGWALADSTLVIGRWGHFRTLDNITQAAQFLQTIGGRI